MGVIDEVNDETKLFRTKDQKLRDPSKGKR
jgi:hypothetical protein